MWRQCSSACHQSTSGGTRSLSASSGSARGRYADSVLKGYATAASVLLTGLLSCARSSCHCPRPPLLATDVVPTRANATIRLPQVLYLAQSLICILCSPWSRSLAPSSCTTIKGLWWPTRSSPSHRLRPRGRSLRRHSWPVTSHGLIQPRAWVGC